MAGGTVLNEVEVEVSPDKTTVLAWLGDCKGGEDEGRRRRRRGDTTVTHNTKARAYLLQGIYQSAGCSALAGVAVVSSLSPFLFLVVFVVGLERGKFFRRQNLAGWIFGWQKKWSFRLIFRVGHNSVFTHDSITRFRK